MDRLVNVSLISDRRDRTGAAVSWCGVGVDGYGSSTMGETPADQRRARHNQLARYRVAVRVAVKTDKC